MPELGGGALPAYLSGDMAVNVQCERRCSVSQAVSQLHILQEQPARQIGDFICRPEVGLNENQTGQYDFLCPVADAVHMAYPLHLILGFQGFGSSLPLFHRGDDTVHAFIACGVDFGKTFPEFPG